MGEDLPIGTAEDHNLAGVEDSLPLPPQYQGRPYVGQIPVPGTDPSISPKPFMTEQRLAPEYELELLRQQAEYIESDLQRIQQRINELSQNAD